MLTSIANPPSYFFWAETSLVSGQWRTFVRSVVSTNYNDPNIGKLIHTDDYLRTFRARYPVTTDKPVAPQMFISPDRRFFWVFHVTSRSYRLYYSATPLPLNTPFSVQCNTCIVFLDRNQKSDIPAGDTGDFRTRLLTRPSWGSWAYDDRYHMTGIRPDLPSTLISWNSPKTRYNVGEYGGSATFKISEAQLPAHNHFGFGENQLGNVGILGAAGIQDNIGTGDSDNDNLMLGTTFSGSNSPILTSTPYYALAYIMYVGT
jgi:hypothetical protein